MQRLLRLMRTTMLVHAGLAVATANAQSPDPLPTPDARIGADGNAQHIAPLPNGDAIVFGYFDHVGDRACAQWGLLHADGTADCWAGPVLGGATRALTRCTQTRTA